MQIQVIDSGPDAWYSESIGNKFEAWEHPGDRNIYFVSLELFVLKSDCIVIINENEKRSKIQTN